MVCKRAGLLGMNTTKNCFMKHPAFYVPVFVAVALFHCSCVESHHAIFSEAAFASSLRLGSGDLQGKAFLTLRNGDRQIASRTAVVTLMPSNGYTDEIANQHFGNRVKFGPPDPRLAKYIRTTHPDQDGNFAFTNLAPGDYWLSCRLYWNDEVPTVDDNGSSATDHVRTSQYLYGLFHVQNGQKSTVTEWRQGDPKHILQYTDRL